VFVIVACAVKSMPIINTDPPPDLLRIRYNDRRAVTACSSDTDELRSCDMCGGILGRHYYFDCNFGDICYMCFCREYY
jgi:hypothetical protein